MYKPAARPDGKVLEYVELFNSNPFFEDLSGFRLSGFRLSGDIDFIFPANTVLPGGGFLVVAKVPADVQSVYGVSNVVGPYTGSLKASGPLRLRTDTGAILLEIPYSNKPPWPVAADGTGHSLVLARPSYGEGFPQAWDISDVVINEIMYAPISGDSRDQYVELFNQGGAPIDLSGWQFTRGVSFTFPTNTVLGPGQYLVVAKDVARLASHYPNLNSSNTIGDFAGSLSGRGERLALAKPDQIISTNKLNAVVTNLDLLFFPKRPRSMFRI